MFIYFNFTQIHFTFDIFMDSFQEKKFAKRLTWAYIWCIMLELNENFVHDAFNRKLLSKD